MNRKGSSVVDTMIGWFMVVGFAIGAILAILLVTNIGGLLSTSFASEPIAQDVVTNYTTVLPSIFDWLFLLLIIAIPLINLGLAIVIPVNPVWYWIYIAMTLPFMLIVVFLGDAWTVFLSPTIMADTATLLPIISFIMNRFEYYAALVFVLTGIGTYVKIRGLELYR